MSDTSRLKNTVYVGGLDNAVSAHTLHEAFIPFGEIIDISLPKPDLPSNTDPHRGFGYVEFQEAEDAREAIDNMDQSELYGRVIKVAHVKPQKEQNEGLGSKTAVWEQVSHDYFSRGRPNVDRCKGGLAREARCQRRRPYGGRGSTDGLKFESRGSNARPGRSGYRRTETSLIVELILLLL